MGIEIIHQAVLTHLLKNNQECFSLRSKDKRNEDKLSRGYWFLGNENYTVISFWKGNDWRAKVPNIFFGIAASGRTWLECVDRDGSNKSKFFEEIAPILGLKHIKNKRDGEEKFLWQKNYANVNNNYIEYLDEFLTKDKQIIDALIVSKNKTALFPVIVKKEFQENLKNIEIQRQLIPIYKYISQPLPILSVPLKRIILYDIGHFKQIKLDLDRQVIGLIGENGSGKSFIIRSIALGLAGINENDVIDPNNEAIQKMLRIESIEKDRETYSPQGQIRLYYGNKGGLDYERGEKNFINFAHQRGETVESNGNIRNDFNRIEDDTVSDLTATRGNNFVSLVIGFSQMKSLQDDRNGSSTESDLKPRISEVTSLIYNLPDKAFNHFTTWIIKLWSAKTNPNDRELQHKLLHEIFSVIYKIVGGTFELMPMQVEQSEIFVKTLDAPLGIPLRLISQGYKNVIGWVGYFMQRLWEVTEFGKAGFKNTPAVCLIDEIDTYLHPKWQKTILSVLVEQFPNTQFVVTTHSPLVITHLDNRKKNVAIYRISKDGAEEVHAAGQDISTAILRHFGIQRRPLYYQEKIDSLFSNIDSFEENNYEASIESLEKELEELRNILGNEDPDVVSAARILEMLKIPMD